MGSVPIIVAGLVIVALLVAVTSIFNALVAEELEPHINTPRPIAAPRPADLLPTADEIFAEPDIPTDILPQALIEMAGDITTLYAQESWTAERHDAVVYWLDGHANDLDQDDFSRALKSWESSGDGTGFDDNDVPSRFIHDPILDELSIHGYRIVEQRRPTAQTYVYLLERDGVLYATDDEPDESATSALEA